MPTTEYENCPELGVARPEATCCCRPRENLTVFPGEFLAALRMPQGMLWEPWTSVRFSKEGAPRLKEPLVVLSALLNSSYSA